jgi:hypothetical protein
MTNQDSYSPLLTSTKDLPSIIKDVQEHWLSGYVELFKAALLTPIPDQSMEFPLLQYGATIARAINDNIGLITAAKTTTATFDTELSKTATYIDMDATFDGRLINPSTIDLYPTISIITESLYTIHDVNTGTPLPNEVSTPLPIMHIYPAIYNMFSFQKIYSKYNEKDLYYNGRTNPILEINIYSIINDVRKLLTEYDGGTKTLTKLGQDMLLDIVYHYTEYTICLIIINLMKNHNASQEIINEFHGIFQSIYQSAFKVQHAMYAIFDRLFRTRFGICIARLRSMEYVTCSLELLYADCGISSDMWAFLNNVLSPHYIEQLKGTHSVLMSSELRHNFCENKLALTRVLKTVVSMIVSCIIQYLDSPPLIKMGFAKAIKDKLAEICTSSNIGGAGGQINLFKQTLGEMMQCFSVDGVLEKLEKVVDPTFQYGGYNVMGCIHACSELYKDNPLITEHTTILKELYMTGSSAMGMRDITTRLQDMKSYEDAFALKLDIESYLDILDSNTQLRDNDADIRNMRYVLNSAHISANVLL